MSIRAHVVTLIVPVAFATACDGSGLAPERGARLTPDVAAPEDTAPVQDSAPAPDTKTPEVTEPEPGPVFEATTDLGVVAPLTRPLPSGTTEGGTLVVARAALKGRFLYGMGADPDGVMASLGGGAAGLMPMRAVVVLVPGADDSSAGTFEIRAWDPDTNAAVPGADGLIESYAYSDVDADTVRVDFAAASAPIEIALYGSCRYVLSSSELHAPPLYADGLLTWPADEVYTREGQCQWVPRTAEGVHVHYLRHDLAGRDFVPRSVDPSVPFGFFLAGTEAAPLIARLPGIAADEPAKTYTYYLVDFPEAYVPAAKETFDAWNDALEEITGRRPFEVAIAPDDFIAWDPRHHAVVWSKTGSGGAVAPFTNDPDSGEIFQSLVVMWFGEVGDLVTTYRDFFGQHPDIADALAPSVPGGPGEPSGQPLPPFAGFDPQAAIARRAIAQPVRPAELAPRVQSLHPYEKRPLASERSLASWRELLARDYTDEELTHIIVVDFLLHEVGHNLGLRHNFIGSVDKHRHEATQTASTTMDYVIGMLHPGSYDRDAMRFGYGANGVESTDYLYCTDETMELEPACVQWDFGHPVRYQLDTLAAYFAAYTSETDDDEIGEVLQYLDPELNRARSFVNSKYEHWDETPVATFEALLDAVQCPGECTAHPALRSALALYLLYSKHMVTAWWEPGYPDVWLDFPALDRTQSALLMDAFFTLVTTSEQPLQLRTTIVGKLPTSAVSGASELLTALHEHYAASDKLDGDDAAVKAAVDEAFAAL